MKNILISVDSIKEAEEILALFQNLRWRPESIILLYVEQPVSNAMLSDIRESDEISTLKQSQNSTDNKEKLDRKAETILDFYKKELVKSGFKNIRSLIRKGHQSEKILKTAEEENVDLIVMHCSGTPSLDHFVTCCASSEVEKHANVPVILTRDPGSDMH